MIKKLFLYILITTFYFIFIQCENGNKTISCFPNSSINVSVDLALPSYQNLASINGWAYVNAGPLSGTRGLIVVRTNTYEFKAYDRNAPHICPGTNTTLEVRDDFYIYCPEDGAKWMFNGTPIGDNSTGKPPRYYNAQLVGSTVIISY